MAELGAALEALAHEHPLAEQRLRAAAAALRLEREAADLEDARDLVVWLGSCTEKELAFRLGVKVPHAAELLVALEARGIVGLFHGPHGRRWHYLPPPIDWTMTRRPRRRPPEKEPPAGMESRATGEPVRVAAMARLTRQGRSTGGLAHFHRQRDLRYKQMEEAKEEAALASKVKAQKSPKWKRNK